jgi:predicted nucleic acid-binding protein
MNAAEKTFVDTNIFVCSVDRSAEAKHKRAQEVLIGLWNHGTGALSTQVLSEFGVNARRLGDLGWSSVQELIEPYLAWEVVTIDRDDPPAALQLAERYQLSYWDALIVRGAIKAGASVLLTEDLSDGQVIEGVRIENPFRGL